MSSRKSDKPFGGRLMNPEWLNPGEQSAPETALKLSEIHLPAHQPRRYFDEQTLNQLVESVKQHGILQPLLVRPHPVNGYELVAGERRYRAAQLAELEKVPVVIRELNDVEAFQLALIENLQREDLNPVEETEGILQLLALQLEQSLETVPPLLRQLFNLTSRSSNDLDGALQPANPDAEVNSADNNVIISKSEMGHDNNVIITIEGDESASKALSKAYKIVKMVFDQLGSMSWESFVTNRLPLLNLPDDVQQALRQGKIAYTKAKVIARVKDTKQRNKLLKTAITKDLSLSQIKEQAQAQPKTKESLPLQEKLTTTYRQVKKAKIWEDPDKSSRLEALLNELQSLLSS